MHPGVEVRQPQDAKCGRTGGASAGRRDGGKGGTGQHQECGDNEDEVGDHFVFPSSSGST